MKRIPIKQVNNRPGVTLTEVLMSLMIMAIGVTSVIALFPIATLRTAQATKLTNSALLKYNMESVLEVRPGLIFDPDGDFSNPLATQQQRLQAITEHFSRPAARNYIVDPVGYFSIYEYSSNLGLSGATFANSFGHDSSNNASSIPRFDGGVVSSSGLAINAGNLRALRMMASELASLGDGWDTLYEFIPAGPLASSVAGGVPDSGGLTVAGVVIPTDVISTLPDLALLPTSMNTIPGIPGFVDPEWTRIIVFTADEDFSQSFPLLQTSSGAAPFTATWSEAEVGQDLNRNGHIDVRTLPREFLVDTTGNGVPDTYRVGKVLIQTRRSVDFNWLLTVRRSVDGRARSIDVVVRFGEDPKFESEMAYPLVAPPTANTMIQIDARAAAGVGVEPAINRGGFVFDLGAARWHRVRNYNEVATDIYDVTLEKPFTSFTGPAMFVPGIVEVYPLGSANIPERYVRGF